MPDIVYMKTNEIIDLERIKDELNTEIESLVGKEEFDQFKQFAFKGHMIQMAIAFILGAAFNNVVKSISENLIMPFLGYIIDKTGAHWREVVFTPIEGINVEFGAFLGAFIDFTITAVVLYIIYKRWVKPLMDVPPPEFKVVDTIECQYCLSRVPYQAAACKNCGRWLDNPYAKEKGDKA